MQKTLPTPEIQRNVLLSKFSTFGIGGPANYFTVVTSILQMQEAIAIAKARSLPFFVIGKGSNLLFDDRGYQGLVILSKIETFSSEAQEYVVGSGYSFAKLGVKTAKNGYKGLEFASGIPGSVGGAIYMNAGAGGSETKDYLKTVLYLEETGEIVEYPKDEICFSYRYSSFQEKKGAILSATFTLELDEQAKERQYGLLNYRLATQPYKSKSAGCCFKNPTNNSAGALIEKAGLKGYQIGGAKISPMHANFITNSGNAKAKDVLDLIAYIKKSIDDKFGILLETEVRFIPYDFQG